MFEHTSSDNYIPYGRGGAGNMRKESSIRDAWRKIAAQPDQHPLVLTSSPEDHYANSKSERHSSSSLRRRSTTSSSWSFASSSEHASSWKRFFKRKSSVEEEKPGETSS